MILLQIIHPPIRCSVAHLEVTAQTFPSRQVVRLVGLLSHTCACRVPGSCFPQEQVGRRRQNKPGSISHGNSGQVTTQLGLCLSHLLRVAYTVTHGVLLKPLFWPEAVIVAWSKEG